MAITILVFMASMGTWWIVPCVGFHLHMRAPCKCNSLSSMRTESAWMNLNEGVSLLQCLTSDICVYYTDTLPIPHSLLTHSAGKCPPQVSVLSLLLHCVSQHLNTLIGRFVCAIALSQVFESQKLFNFVWILLRESFPRGDLTKPWQLWQWWAVCHHGRSKAPQISHSSKCSLTVRSSFLPGFSATVTKICW